MKAIPNYHPPSDYRRPTKTQEKVYVPVNDYPEINFSMIANPRFLTSLFDLSPNLYLSSRIFLLSLFVVLRCLGHSRRIGVADRRLTPNPFLLT